jgi:hypothetical protein
METPLKEGILTIVGVPAIQGTATAAGISTTSVTPETKTAVGTATKAETLATRDSRDINSSKNNL